MPETVTEPSQATEPGAEAKARCGLFASPQPEPQPESTIQPAKRPKFLFTPENAREMQAKAREARLRNQAIPQPAEEPASQPVAEGREYVTSQIVRVRGHLEKIDKLIDGAIAGGDAQAIERLTRARSSLEEIERRVSDRSLPPVLRAIEKQSKRGMLNDLPE